MFKVINQDNGQDIIILDARWGKSIPELRNLASQNKLICPGCQQPVWVRAGAIKIAHFAHKHLQNCTYGEASVEILNARAILYTWLKNKFGDKVSLEKSTGSKEFPTVIDCWVEHDPKNFAYWILDGGLSDYKRDALKQQAHKANAESHWVFTMTVLRQDKTNPDHIHLNTTEREFMLHTEYDQALLGASRIIQGKSLHYLDTSEETLLTFRGLRIVHHPQVFSGHQQHHSLGEILVHPTSGELIHPGEYEQLEAFNKREAQQETKRKSEKLFSIFTITREEFERSSSTASNEEAICEICGQLTSDWWYYNPETKTCKCRDCLRNG